MVVGFFLQTILRFRVFKLMFQTILRVEGFQVNVSIHICNSFDKFECSVCFMNVFTVTW